MFQAPEGQFSHKKNKKKGIYLRNPSWFFSQLHASKWVWPWKKKETSEAFGSSSQAISSLMKRAFRIISEWLHTTVHIFWPVRHIFSTLQWHQETPASFWLISMWWQWNVSRWVRSLLTGSDLVWLIQERDPLQAKEANHWSKSKDQYHLLHLIFSSCN